jgi:hypothetical protein
MKFVLANKQTLKGVFLAACLSYELMSARKRMLMATAALFVTPWLLWPVAAGMFYSEARNLFTGNKSNSNSRNDFFSYESCSNLSEKKDVRICHLNHVKSDSLMGLGVKYE